MATCTVRPFAQHALCASRQALRPKFTRIALTARANKGFGEPKREAGQPRRQDSAQDDSPAEPVPMARRKQVQETPQVVVDRMFRRMITFTGVPVFTGMALYPLFYYLRVVQDIDYPLWIVYVAQVLTFGGGLAGITYGALSASWDPSREGSALGFTELKANLDVLLNKNK